MLRRFFQKIYQNVAALNTQKVKKERQGEGNKYCCSIKNNKVEKEN